MFVLKRANQWALFPQIVEFCHGYIRFPRKHAPLALSARHASGEKKDINSPSGNPEPTTGSDYEKCRCRRELKCLATKCGTAAWVRCTRLIMGRTCYARECHSKAGTSLGS